MGGNISVVGAVIPRWIPQKQSLTASTLVYAGYNVGSIISSLLNGYLCSIDADNGWPFIFYVAAIILAVYAVAWICLMSDSPDTHPFISDKERAYIQASRAQSVD
ncbi:hypothetical protein EGW08_018960, partial [Elysia chlorotica]